MHGEKVSSADHGEEGKGKDGSDRAVNVVRAQIEGTGDELLLVVVQVPSNREKANGVKEADPTGDLVKKKIECCRHAIRYVVR